MPTHTFQAKLAWRPEGALTGTHEATIPGKTSLQVSAAPQYKGDGTKPNPEELFVTALASCQLLSYVMQAPRIGVTVLAYEDDPVGTLAIADKKMRVTEVVLRPRITIAADADEAKARKLVDTAHDGCFIANSVACAVRIEPTIVRA